MREHAEPRSGALRGERRAGPALVSVGSRVVAGAAIGAVVVSVAAGYCIGSFVDVGTSTAAMLGVATGVTGGAFFGGLAAFATSDHTGAIASVPTRRHVHGAPRDTEAMSSAISD